MELRWITRTVVGSDVDPADEYRSPVLQCRSSPKKAWVDVPHADTKERVSAYDGRKLRKGQDGNGR